jgi:Tfp pilus assembly protein FimT
VRRNVIIVIVLVVLVVVGLGLFHRARSGAEARSKAEQLSAAFTAAGLPAPSTDQIVAVLGTDGGAVCVDPAGALHQAAASDQFSNGAGGPGQRPVIATRNLIEAEEQVISVYCPDQLAAFQEYVKPLRTADVAGEVGS